MRGDSSRPGSCMPCVLLAAPVINGWQVPVGVAHQEALDKLWYLREFVAPGTVLLLESFHKHDDGREEAGFQDIVLSVQSQGRISGQSLARHHTARVPAPSEARRPPCAHADTPHPCCPSWGRAHVAAAREVVDHPGDDVVHPGQDLLPGVQGHLPVAEQRGAADPPPVPVGVRLLQNGASGQDGARTRLRASALRTGAGPSPRKPLAPLPSSWSCSFSRRARASECLLRICSSQRGAED